MLSTRGGHYDDTRIVIFDEERSTSIARHYGHRSLMIVRTRRTHERPSTLIALVAGTRAYRRWAWEHTRSKLPYDTGATGTLVAKLLTVEITA